MQTGFFPESTFVSKAPPSLLPKCGICGLKDLCKSPKMKVSGAGRRKILIVAEAPGAEEDKRGLQLVGKSGKYLEERLSSVGINMREDCWLTNAIICRPPNNETPDNKKIEYCRPNLRKTLADHKPHIVIVAGEVALKSILPLVYKDSDCSGINRWAGHIIPCQKINAWICPIYHPAFLGHEEHPKVLENIFHHNLKVISKLKGRPWEKTPNYADRVEIIHNPDLAARIIRKMIDKRGSVGSFDYETNCLKPDNPDARIISCAICLNGERTIAYPWVGAAIHATEDFLLSEIPKRGANIKFEERWTEYAFGHGVNNWQWCTQTAAHVLDCRDPRNTGLKFQAFVRLGEEGYDDAIKPWLKATRGRINRINEVDMNQLLRYNGMDAISTHFVAEKQMELVNGKRTRNL